MPLRHALLLFAFFSLPVMATESANKLTDIRTQQMQIRDDLQAGRLQASARTRKVVEKDQAVVFSILDRNATMDDLDLEERIRLDNAIERIIGALGGTALAQSNQEVCRNERVSGSKLKKVTCETQGDKDRDREGARAWMEKPKVCIPPGCGS